jgi:hypothetical protein
MYCHVESQHKTLFVLSGEVTMYRHRNHFSDRHYEGTTFGPFSFLNPTIRRSPIPLNLQHRSGSETGDEKTPDGESTGSSASHINAASPKGEMRASVVDQKWRSRDNRKGIWSCDT